MKSSLSLQFVFSLFCTFVLVCSSKSVFSQELRVWTSANGKYTFEAKLLSQKDGDLRLKGKDGKVKSLKADQLSSADRKYLRTLSENNSDGKSESIAKQQKERLKRLGLRLTGDELLFIDERKLKSALSKSRKSKQSLVILKKKFGQAELARATAENKIELMKQENVQFNSQLAATTESRERKKIAGLINANVSAMKALERDIIGIRLSMKEKRPYINKARSEFMQQFMVAKQLSDLFVRRVGELRGDDEFQSVLTDVENTIGRKLNELGKSKSLAQLRATLAELEGVLRNDSIKLNDVGAGKYTASVSINGQDSIELVFDSEASLVTLPQQLAGQLGIVVPQNARRIRMSMADGSVIPGRLVNLESVQMGQFTVNDVDCAVLTAEATNAVNLLGMSFLGNFEFEMDAGNSELKIVTVASEE